MKAFIAILLIALPAHGESLSDLGGFIRTAKDVPQAMTDKKWQQGYRQALERYSAPAKVPVSPSFDAAIAQLSKLRKQIRGVDARLTHPAKPLAFQYSDASKDHFRFERVSQVFHSIWLLENLREVEPETCTARDSLLIDRWTPLLKDAHLFSVEKNKRFLGTTITLVPVDGGRLSYLLAVPHDPRHALPAKLLATFLKDFQKRERPWLPLALLADEGKGGYQIYLLDAQGKQTKRLGPAEGFTLQDPMAKTIASAVNPRCARPIAVSVAESDTAITPNDPDSPRVPASSVPAAIANAQTTVNVQAPGAAPATEKALQGKENQSASMTVLRAPGVSTTIVNNIPRANGGDRSAPTGAGSTTVGVMVQPQFAVGVTANLPAGTASQQSTPSRGLASTGPASAPSNNPGQYYSPIDRRLQSAMNQSQDALRNGKPIPPSLFQEIARGMNNTQNPELQQQARQNLSDMYLLNPDPEKSVEAVQKLRSENPEDAALLYRQVNSELCVKCPGCPACRAIQQGAVGGAK
ncbi:hypothetical protein K2X33_15915 [bacterium]|nr:hypothetical protein [bacterium]